MMKPFAALILALLLVPSTLAQDAARPNIVVLFADDLGYGDLSSYGHPTIRTPNLDRMAMEGIRLTSFYAAAPACTPSRAALLTGRYAVRVGLPFVLGPESENGLPPEEITMAEALKDQGYRTMAVGKWHLGHAREAYLPTSNGFDTYFGLLYSNDMMPPWVETDHPLELYRDTQPTEYPVNQRTLTKRYTEEVVRFITQEDDRPFFVYLAYAMPHLPLYASEEFQGRSRAGLYGDVIEEIDWSVGRLLQTLEDQGLDRNTIVIFTSDNGPWSNMPDRMLQDGIERWHAGSTGLLRGTKHTTYEGGVRVPGIARWPGHIPPGQVTAEMATTMDLYPTLLNAAGAPLPVDRRLDGNDIMSLLDGTASESPTQTFFYFRNDELQGIREGRWKLRLEDPDQPPELFDLEVDPSEQYNVAATHPDLVDRLRQRLLEFEPVP